jgi:hypothetical protein
MRVVSRQIRIRRLEGSLTGAYLVRRRWPKSFNRSVRRPTRPPIEGGCKNRIRGSRLQIARDLASILHEIESGEGRVNDQIHA